MWRVALIFTVLCFYFKIHFVESWKMKVCLNGTIYSVEEYKCRAGIWFVEPKHIPTICFEKGMWAIYRDWCEQNPILWTVHPETKGCIHNLKRKTIGIMYLGNHEKGGLISTTARRLFLSNKYLKNERKLNFLDANELEVLTWGGTTQYSLEQKYKYTNEQKCLIKGKNSFFGYYNFDLKDRSNISIHLGENLCTDRKFQGTRAQTLPKNMDFEIHQSDKNSVDMTCQPYTYPFVINEDYLEEDDDPVNVIQQKVDDQSQRVGLKLYALKFNKESPSDMDFEEWKFLQLAVDIFKKTCPNGMVSKFYLDNVFLLFQFLIHESFNLFPPNVDKDDDTRLRIWNALKRCEANATILTFKNDQTCAKGSPLLKFQPRHGTTVLRLIELPRQIRINVEKFDLILESVWKLMVFIHYYCAESFNEYSSDLSVLQNRWQSLLAPDIIRRWKNPGRSYEMMQRIFMSISLSRTVKNIDYCVGAAHMYSPYKGWLKRPLTKWDFRERNASKDDLIWDGHAYCVDDFTYPAVKLGYPIEKCGIKNID